MRVDSLHPSLVSLTRPAVRDGRGLQAREPQTETAGSSQRQPSTLTVADQERVLGSLRQFANLSNQANADGSRHGLPLRSQQALDAYIEPRREEEKSYLHQVMGIDTFA